MKIDLKTVFLPFVFQYTIGQSIQQAPQSPQPHTYQVMKVNSPATDSKIEVAKNGDTVLVSKYVMQNVNNYSRQYFEKTYKGTPFFKNAWQSGILYFADGSTINGTIAYNLVNELVYYSLGNLADASEAKPIGFTIGNITLKKLDPNYETRLSSYLETIFMDPRVALFRQYKCIYKPKITGDRLGYEASGGDYEGNYEKSSSLYMGFQNQIIELKTTKGIFKQFGEYKTAMEQFAQTNNLNPKRQADTEKMVVHFANIIETYEKPNH